jgi:hypothetical protein
MDVEDLSKLDGRRLIKESGDLFLNEYYQSFLPGFTDLIRHSKERAWYKDPLKHYGLQVSLLESLQNLEKVSSDGKKLAQAQGSEELALQSKRNKFLSKGVKEIADGIAWRTLDHSRFKLRVLSQGRYAGHTWGKEGQRAELRRAEIMLQNGGLVLLNDVTNCLRIGDIILLNPKRPDTCYITEIKKHEVVTPTSILKKVDNHKALDKQEKRLIQAQIAIHDNIFPLRGQRLPVVPITVPLHDVLSSAGAVAKQAAKRGAAWRMVTPYMRVEAIDMARLAAVPDFEAVIDSLGHPDATPLFGHSNYDHLMANSIGEVERSSPPYTIFPWPVDIIAKIITGGMYIQCMLYRQPLEAAFRALGWDLIIDEEAAKAYDPPTDAENVAELSSELLFPRTKEIMPGSMILRHNPSGFNMYAFEAIVQMAREYLTVQHVIAVAEAVKSKTTKGAAQSIFPEVQDARRWI